MIMIVVVMYDSLIDATCRAWLGRCSAVVCHITAAMAGRRAHSYRAPAALCPGMLCLTTKDKHCFTVSTLDQISASVLFVCSLIIAEFSFAKQRAPYFVFLSRHVFLSTNVYLHEPGVQYLPCMYGQL